MQIIKPTYYDRFACLAGACPDTCCGAWQVEIDGASLAFYQALGGPLGDRVRSAMAEEDGAYHFVTDGGACALLTPEGLCAVQCALGETALCRSCGFYPRFVTEIGARRELGLCLSCPEAARLILADPAPFALCEEETDEPIRAIHELSPALVLTLRRLRARALELAQDRSLPFGQRCARMFFVVGTSIGTYEGEYDTHHDWQRNYALAKALTERLKTIHPYLATDIRLKVGRYNQHVSPYCMLIELGHNANTFSDAVNSIPYLADAIADTLIWNKE